MHEQAFILRGSKVGSMGYGEPGACAVFILVFIIEGEVGERALFTM
jgi:hypothetical protein